MWFSLYLNVKARQYHRLDIVRIMGKHLSKCCSFSDSTLQDENSFENTEMMSDTAVGAAGGTAAVEGDDSAAHVVKLAQILQPAVASVDQQQNDEEMLELQRNHNYDMALRKMKREHWHSNVKH